MITIKTVQTLSSLTDHQDGIKTEFYKKSAMIRDISSGVHSVVIKSTQNMLLIVSRNYRTGYLIQMPAENNRKV